MTWGGYDLDWSGITIPKAKPKCECGLHKVDDKATDEQHSDYCAVYQAWLGEKNRQMTLDEMYKNIVIT